MEVPILAKQEFTLEEFATEEWRDIPDYEGFYQVSSLGRVRSSSNERGLSKVGRLLRPGISADGYPRVVLSKCSKKTSCRVHRLVALTFSGPAPKGYQVDHVDGNKTNARSSNLEYVTHAENHRRASKLGLCATGDRNGSRTHIEKRPRGEQSPMHKLTLKEVLEIRDALKTGKHGIGKVLARRYGVSAMNISYIKRGKKWKPFPPESPTKPEARKLF